MKNILDQVKKKTVIALVIVGVSSIVLTIYRIMVSRKFRVQLEDGDDTPVNE